MLRIFQPLESCQLIYTMCLFRYCPCSAALGPILSSTLTTTSRLSASSRRSNFSAIHSRVLAQNDISVAFWHALLPEDEPIAMYPPRSEEEAGYMWQMKRAMYGTTRAPRLFQEHMKGVLLETESMAAIHGPPLVFLIDGPIHRSFHLPHVSRFLHTTRGYIAIGSSEVVTVRAKTQR